jgi:ABC-type multidrug transport system fused ATPase/permease subunit
VFIDAATGTVTIATPLAMLAVVFIAVAIVQQVVSVAATYLSESVGWTATNALRADLAAHCMRLDMPFHNQHTPGEFIERIDGDVSALANFFSAFIIQVFGNLILLAGVLILLAMADWRIGLMLFIFVIGSRCCCACAKSPRRCGWPSARPSPTTTAFWRSAWPAQRTSAAAARANTPSSAFTICCVWPSAPR